MTIPEFKEKHVSNERREELFASFSDEIAYMKDFLEEIKIAVFGSFITEKDLPNDIDIIVMGTFNDTGYQMQTEHFPRLIPTKNGNIHRKSKFYTGKIEKSIAELVDDFNEDTNNKKEGIFISEFIEIELD